MSILFTLLWILGGILIFLLILAIIIPKHYSVAVSVTIDKPKHVVHDYIRLLRNQLHYSEWLLADPDLKPEVVGQDGTVGALLKWESDNSDKEKNVGMGEQEIKDITDERIDVELRLIKPMAGICKLSNTFIAKSTQQTEYVCTFYGYAKFPINLPSYLLGRYFIRKTQQKTICNAKRLIEAV